MGMHRGIIVIIINIASPNQVGIPQLSSNSPHYSSAIETNIIPMMVLSSCTLFTLEDFQALGLHNKCKCWLLTGTPCW